MKKKESEKDCGHVSEETMDMDTEAYEYTSLLTHTEHKKKKKTVCRYVYISHFLSAWGDRMWQFGVGLLLVIISPDSLLLTAIYGFAMGTALLLFGPLVGDWVDKTARLTAAKVTLVVQNLSIAVCAAVVYFVIVYKSEIEAEWEDGGLLLLSYAVIIAIAIIAQLASTGNTIAVEKDWIVEMCGSDHDLLASTSAVLKSIDLITQIAAPIATGQIMAYASTEIGALFIGGWNLVSVFVEYWLLWKVYSVVPELRARKDFKVAREEEHNSGRDPLACVKGLFRGFLILARGWRTYIKYDVAFAGLGLACLYMTVLGFDNITVGFAYTQGVNESVMGGLMAAGALFGILGTFIYPRMRKLIGLQRTGLFGLFFQVSFLSLCVASIWLPGSPFDLHYNDKDSENIGPDSTNATITPIFSTVTSFPFENVTNADTTKDWHDYVSVGMLMTGIIGARCGLWMADLTITQLYLEAVVESERGIVLGVQTSLNQLMDMLKFTMVIVAPEPEVFGVLIIVSFVFVCIGWGMYANYSRKSRGHLFHFDKLSYFYATMYSDKMISTSEFLNYNKANLEVANH